MIWSTRGARPRSIIEPYLRRRHHFLSTRTRLEVSTMRNATRISLCGWLLVAAFALGGAASPGCRRTPLRRKRAGGMGIDRGRRAVSAGAAGGVGGGSTGTGTGGVPAACAGASDARLVVARQRILRLTMNETLNTVRYLFGDTEATRCVSEGLIGIGGRSDRHRAGGFRRCRVDDHHGRRIHDLDRIADDVARYVDANSRRSPRVRPPPMRARPRTSTSWRRGRTGGSSRRTSRPGSPRSTPSCAARRRSTATRSPSPSRKRPATRSTRC